MYKEKTEKWHDKSAETCSCNILIPLTNLHQIASSKCVCHAISQFSPCKFENSHRLSTSNRQISFSCKSHFSPTALRSKLSIQIARCASCSISIGKCQDFSNTNRYGVVSTEFGKKSNNPKEHNRTSTINLLGINPPSSPKSSSTLG